YKKYGMLVYAVSLLAIPALFALIKYGPDIIFLDQNLLFYILIGLLFFVCFNLLRDGFKRGPVARDRILVLMILMTFNVVFWALFEQAGSSLTLFADRNVDRSVFGWFSMTASQTQVFNPLFIILFGSIFSVMWVSLARIGKNPNIPMKFGLGIIQLGLGYLVLLLGIKVAGTDAMVPLVFLGLMYLLHTTGELFLSPIGLSMITKLSPKHMTGSAMGAWFLSAAFSMHVASGLAVLTGGGEEGEAAGEAVIQLSAAEQLENFGSVFGNMGYVAVGIGVLLVLLSKPLNKMMHGVE
ncbi:MFS transporter, partial [bacterium DOLZORAL124_64_63]